MKTAYIIAAVAVAAVLCVSAAALLSSDGEEYSITYVLNGGTQNDLNPDSYVSGDTVRLYDATSDRYYFDGWFLDEDLTVRCDSVTADMTGDLTLYAGWTESLAGKGFTLSLEGTVMNGLFNSYGLAGEATYRYMYLDPDTGRYLLSYDSEIDYDYGFYVHSESGSRTYWSGDSDVTWSDAGTETIDTVDGEKECAVMVATYGDGSTETQWIGDGWIPYRIVYESSGIFSSSRITYELTSHFSFDTEDELEVEAYADEGLTVSGDGMYSPGDSVTLTASGDGFAGWYDSDGNLLSTSATYTIDVLGSDTTLYACNVTDNDLTWRQGTEYDLLDVELESAVTTVTDSNTGDVLAVFDDTSPTMAFDEAGEYTVTIDGTAADGSGYHRFYGVLVDGTVVRSFEWESDGRSYEYTMEIEYSDLLYYRDYYDADERQQDVYTHQRDRTFVTYQDPYVQDLAEYIAAETSGLSDLERVQVVVSLTQYIEYQSDEVFMGYEEYWKFPLETLYDQGGDCEDTSILCAALTKALGYDSALLLFTGHMAAGVDVDGCTGSYFAVDGSRYYYCETTATGYDVGEIPSSMYGYRATVVVV